MGLIGSGNSRCKGTDCEQGQGLLVGLEHRCVGGRSQWGRWRQATPAGRPAESGGGGGAGRGLGEGIEESGLQ